MDEVSFPALKIQKKKKKDDTCVVKMFSVYPFMHLYLHFLKLNMELFF